MGINICTRRYFLRKTPAIQVPIVATVDALLTSSSHLLHHFARLVSQIEQGWWKEVPLTCALVIWRPQGLVGEVDWRWLKPPWNAWYIFFPWKGVVAPENCCNYYFCPQNWGISGVLMAVICVNVFQEDILIEVRISSLWAKVLPGSQESLVSLVLQL